MLERGDPSSDVFLVMDGLGPKAGTLGLRMGSGYGCVVSEPADYEFTDTSLAEVNCYWAGGGEIFQALVNDAGDLEVLRYGTDEFAGMGSPQSVYTFNLGAGQRAVSDL